MQIEIEVLTATKTTATSKTGKPYTMVEVAYKQDGAVKGKKLLEFKAKDICKVLGSAITGDKFTVVQEKEGDFWEWKSISSSTATASSVGAATSTPTAAGVKTTPKGDWETKEERAAKQVMIVKQSSLAQAVASLKLDKAVVDPTNVLALAQTYTDWVLAKPELPEVAAKKPDPFDDDVEF